MQLTREFLLFIFLLTGSSALFGEGESSSKKASIDVDQEIKKICSTRSTTHSSGLESLVELPGLSLGHGSSSSSSKGGAGVSSVTLSGCSTLGSF